MVLILLDAVETVLDPASWEVLLAQRWGTDPSPGIVVPTDTWQAEVAGWGMQRWLAWHQRAGELEAEEVQSADGPTAWAESVKRAQRRAYDEIRNQRGAESDER